MSVVVSFEQILLLFLGNQLLNVDMYFVTLRMSLIVQSQK